jgi:hypothetical protein
MAVRSKINRSLCQSGFLLSEFVTFFTPPCFPISVRCRLSEFNASDASVGLMLLTRAGFKWWDRKFTRMCRLWCRVVHTRERGLRLFVVAVLLLLGSQCSRNSAFSERAGNINCIGHRTLACGPRPTSAGQFSWKQATWSPGLGFRV